MSDRKQESFTLEIEAKKEIAMIDETRRSVSESKKVDGGGGGTVLEIVKKQKTPLPKSNHRLLQY